MNSARVFEIELTQRVDRKQPAEFISKLFFGELRRAVFPLLVCVAGQDEHFRAWFGGPFQRGENRHSLAAAAVEAATVEDERAFEEQIQLLENIVTDIYAKPRRTGSPSKR